MRHPSLKSKKKQGEDVWEARIDYHYRFTFIIDDEQLIILLLVSMIRVWARSKEKLSGFSYWQYSG